MTFPLTKTVIASLRRLRDVEAEERCRRLRVVLCPACGDARHHEIAPALSACEIISCQEKTFVLAVGLVLCESCGYAEFQRERWKYMAQPPPELLPHHAEDLRAYILAGNHKN